VQDAYIALASIYDRLVGFEEDVGFYESLAQRYGGPVLEIGAGTGRIALPLARRGYDVVALDRSEAMVAVGREAATGAGLPITWRVGDVSEGRLGGPYRLIVWGLDGFLHLLTEAAQLRALTAVRRALHPEGSFALDLPSLASWWDWQPGVRPLELTWTSTEQTGAAVLHYETFSCDPAEQTRTVTHVVESVAPDGTVSKRVASYALRFVGRFELGLLLRRARLRVLAEYGDYELNPPRPESERLLVLAGV
jgi:SAM-dependent methyltransferase